MLLLKALFTPVTFWLWTVGILLGSLFIWYLTSNYYTAKDANAKIEVAQEAVVINNERISNVNKAQDVGDKAVAAETIIVKSNRAISNSLRKQANSKPVTVDAATQATRTNTYRELFEDCREEVVTLAEKAGRHAIDVATLVAAWPSR